MYSGLSFAILQSSGNEDNEIDRLIRLVIGEAKTGASSFRNLPVRLSIPALLRGFNCCKSFKTEVCATGSKEKLFLLDSNFRNTF